MKARIVLLLMLCCSDIRVLAQADSSQKLRGFFEEIAAGAPAQIAGYELHHPRELADFYGARNHSPVWTASGPLATQTELMLDAIRQSEAHGLNGYNYHEAALAKAIEEGARMVDLAFELLLGDAFFRQARHRSTGAVSPQELDPEWLLIAPEIDLGAYLRRAIEPGGNVLQVLDNLWPKHEEYAALLAKRAQLAAHRDEDPPPIPDGPLLKTGRTDERVASLKQRLLGPGEYNDEFDAGLKEAVTAFQRAAGLESDGIVGPATLEVLNATSGFWVDRIDANLERWRWLPQTMPESYIRVNIAAFTLRVVQRGQTVLSMDAIVGRPYRRTPIFSESIKYLVFNPYWNVPFKLAVEDKLPIPKKGPSATCRSGLRGSPCRPGTVAERRCGRLERRDPRQFSLSIAPAAGPAERPWPDQVHAAQSTRCLPP